MTREKLIANDVIRAGALPPLRERDLPEPLPLRKMVGPGVMLAGLALGSGEFVLWPYITFESGFVFFWACLLGVATQYFLNMEITRWSLATGESAITGFARLGRIWAYVFLFMNIIPFMIPAWSQGAAQLLGWLFAGETVSSRTVTWVSIGGLLFCGTILTAGKVVYETVERIQKWLVSAILLLVVILACLIVRWDAVLALLQGAVNIGGFPPLSVALDEATLLGAIAFAGAGGTLNLCQSNYIKDKGYGMGHYIGRITSPITGQPEAISELGFHFKDDERNRLRWNRWWRAASQEHFLSFFLTCLISLVLLTLISYSIFYDAAGTPIANHGDFKHDISFILGEAMALDTRFGSLARVTFLVMGIAILLTTEFGVLDASSRVSTDIVKVNFLRKNEAWTESKLYYLFLWTTIVLGSALLLIGPATIKGAFTLFKYTSAMNGGVMFIYSALLLYLCRFRLPKVARMSWWRALIMIWSVLFFGAFTVRLLWQVL